MRLLALLLGALSLSAPAHAQYFSKGWAPGDKPVTSATPATTSAGYTPPSAAATPTKAASLLPTKIPTLKELSEMLELSNLLAAPPIAALAAKVGINVTERLADLKAHKYWDARVPLITDENYAAMVVNETMSEEEEKERVWFVIITVTASTPQGISKFADTVFDAAYNATVEAGDLPHVRWARIDYLNVTALTTKWNVWSAPYLMVITDRGQTLRFWKATQVRLNEETIRTFLSEEGWRNSEPWRSSFGPGGDREWLMEHFANAMTYSYNGMMLLPKWLLYVITGAVGSVIIGLLHRTPTPPAKKVGSVAAPAAGVGKVAAVKEVKVEGAKEAPASPKKKGGAKGKKSGRK